MNSKYAWAMVMTVILGMGGCARLEVPVERPGEVTMQGKPVTLQGQTPAVGDHAPGFTAVANNMSTFTFMPGGKVWILTAVPSLETKVCSVETRRFNEEAAKLGADAGVITVSMDLPFTQKKWCGAEGIERVKTVSDYRDRAFGLMYGVRIKESGLLSRSVFVVDRSGKIVYEEIVPELSREPNYAAALAAAKLAGGS